MEFFNSAIDVLPVSYTHLGGAYPELVEKQKYIHKVIENEEASFNKTIDSGLAILNDKIAASEMCIRDRNTTASSTGEHTASML